MADALLKEAVRRSKNDPWLQLHHANILEQKGRFANALRQARRANIACPNTPKCAFALALAIMHYAREEAVQFANFSAAANRATTSAERNSQMQLRMATAQSLVMLYSQWVSATRD